MRKATIGKWITFLSDAAFKIKIASQVEMVRHLLHKLPTLKKQVPWVVLYIGVLISGLVVTWGLLVVIGVFTLHQLSLTWLQALISVFVIELVILGIILKIVSRGNLYEWARRE